MSEIARAADEEIRSIFLPLQTGSLLVPNSVVAEVISYREPEPVINMPDWVLGAVSWRQRSLYLLSFDRILGEPLREAGIRRRIAVCHTLRSDNTLPYVAILTNAIPRLVRISESVLEPLADDYATDELPITCALRVHDEEAWIPDLDRLQAMLSTHAR